LSGALPLVAMVASCNLIIDAGAMSCSSNDDCVNFDNHVCDTNEGVCISADTCASNSECAADEVCRPAQPRRCEKLLQGNCQEVYPDNDTFRDDNAILIGVTAPLTVSDVGTGTSIVNGAKLGVDQFNKDGGVEGTRPLVLVICDDTGDTTPAAQNGQTLAKIGVPVIIGPAFSGQTLETAGTDQAPGTVANDVLLISPSATSPLVTGIDDTSPKCLDDCEGAACDSCPGLVWRTSPSDIIQGAGMSQYFTEELEQRVRDRGGITRTGNIKVYVLYKPDPYGDLLSEVIRTQLIFNGESATTQQNEFFFRVEYADADAATAGIQPDPAAIQAAIDADPDAIFIIGTGESAKIIKDIELGWSASGKPEADRPYYFLGDGGLGGDTAAVARGEDTDPLVPPVDPVRPVIERIRGSIPGPILSSTFDAFRGDYNGKFPADPETGHGATTFGASGAYDIVFMIAYSTIAARGAPITAEQLARGFASLSDTEATTIQAGSTSIGQAASILGDGGTINFEGASGSLDFDLSTGEAASPIQIWCIAPSGEAGENSGAYYDGTGLAGESEPAIDAFSCPFL
jgi:branched-chain amino acid transport system substrate-binding protein